MTTDSCLIASAGWAVLTFFGIAGLVAAELIYLSRRLSASTVVRITTMLIGTVGAIGGFLSYALLVGEGDFVPSAAFSMTVGAGLAVGAFACLRWCFGRK